MLARVRTHFQISHLTRQLRDKNRALEREIAKRRAAEADLMRADEEITLLAERETARWGIEGFIGESQTIQKILADVRKLQNADTTNVLIVGESGTGKELVARAIHFGGHVAQGRFVPVNCAAIPGELAESLLFGHIKGAFTGANTSRKGHFELAHGGTLFLDEIGDMPLELQAKLLRVIEDGVVTPVGGTQEKLVNVRVLSATNANLQTKMTQGTFRADLYYRLATFVVTVPPLRERPDDIPLLAQHFLKTLATEMRRTSPKFSTAALAALETHPFPGNVRELRNIVERALLECDGPVILPKHLNFLNINPPMSQTAMDTHVELAQLKPTQQPDDARILHYLRQHGSINNTQCRDLLSVSLRRASYLLIKMYEAGVLARDGEKRWARYRLP